MITKLKQFSKTYLFKLIMISFLTMIGIYLIPIISSGYAGFDNSDGMLQYRAYMKSFFNALDNNSFDTFNMHMLHGTSIFALEYYVPLDIFTLILYILHFIIDFNYAFAFVRLLMIFSGTITFYLMSKKVFKLTDKTSFLLSLLWIISGSVSVFINYYAYCALYFYVPVAMYLFDLAHNKHKYISVGFFTMVLMLYNFYLGYVIIMVTIFVTVTLNFMRRDSTTTFKTQCKKELKQLCFDAIPILLGVLSASFIILPTVLYLLNYTSTSRVGKYYSVWHFIHLIARMFVPTFESAFTISKYDQYINCQMSLYITVFGCLSLINLFISDKENRKRYLHLLGVLLVMLIAPFIAYFFTASKAVYGRWYFLFTLIELYYVGVNYENNYLNLDALERKVGNTHFKIKHLIAIIAVLIIITYFILLMFLGTDEYAKSMITISCIIALFAILGIIYLKNHRKIIMIIEGAGTLILMFSFSLFAIFPKTYIQSENILNKVSAIDSDYISRYNTDILVTDVKDDNSNSITTVYSSECNFFSSFWNHNANPYIQNYVTRKSTNNWNFSTINNTSIFNSTFLGYEYYILKSDKDYIIPDYLKLVKDENGLKYYLNIYYNGFGTVYYKTTNDISDSYMNNQFMLTDTCWLGDSNTIPKAYVSQLTDFNHILKKGETSVVIGVDDFDLNTYYQFYQSSTQIIVNYKDGSQKETLDSTLLITDDIESISFSLYKNTKYLSYTKCSKKEYEEQVDCLSNKIGINVEKNGNTFSTIYNKDRKEKAIIVLPVTYTDEFKCNEDFNIIKSNGSFIGIELPEDLIGEVSLSITFEPKGLKEGIVASIIFGTISICFITGRIIYIKKKD